MNFAPRCQRDHGERNLIPPMAGKVARSRCQNDDTRASSREKPHNPTTTASKNPPPRRLPTSAPENPTGQRRLWVRGLSYGSLGTEEAEPTCVALLASTASWTGAGTSRDVQRLWDVFYCPAASQGVALIRGPAVRGGGGRRRAPPARRRRGRAAARAARAPGWGRGRRPVRRPAARARAQRARGMRSSG